MKDARDLDEMAAELGRVGQWAPGEYCGVCQGCQRGFTDDKRATLCLPCAVAQFSDALSKPLTAVDRLCLWHHDPDTFAPITLEDAAELLALIERAERTGA